MPAKKVWTPDLTMFGTVPNETSASAMILLPTASTERDSAPFATNTLAFCRPALTGENTYLNAMSVTQSPSLSMLRL